MSIPVLPASSADLSDYVRRLLDCIWIASRPDDEKDEAAQLITSAVRHNPRRVIQFINRMSAKLLLVAERQAAGIFPKDLTPRLSLIACACAVEEESEELAELIATDPHVYDDLVARMEGRPPIGITTTDEFLKGSVPPGYPALLHVFADVRGEQIAPLFRLRSDEDRVYVPDPDEFRQHFVDGDIQWASDRARSNPSLLTGMARYAAKLHNQFVGTRTVFADGVAAVAGVLSQELATSEDPVTARWLSTQILRRRNELQMRERLFVLPLASLRGLVRNATPEIQALVAEQLIPYVENPSNSTWGPLSNRLADEAVKRDTLVEMAHWAGLSLDVRRRIGEQLASVAKSAPEALDELLDTEDARRCITLSVLATRLQTLQAARFAWSAEPTEEERPTELRFIETLGHGPEAQAGLYVEGCERVISFATNPEVALIVRTYLWKWLRSLRLEAAQIDHSRLFVAIHGAYGSLQQPPRAYCAIEALAVSSRLTTKERQQALELARTNLTTDGSAEFVSLLRERYATLLDEVPEGPALAADLMARWRSAPGEAEAALLALDLTRERSKGDARAFIAEIITAGHARILPVALVTEAYAGASDGELDGAVAALRSGWTRGVPDEASVTAWLSAARALAPYRPTAVAALAADLVTASLAVSSPPAIVARAVDPLLRGSDPWLDLGRALFEAAGKLPIAARLDGYIAQLLTTATANEELERESASWIEQTVNALETGQQNAVKVWAATRLRSLAVDGRLSPGVKATVRERVGKLMYAADPEVQPAYDELLKAIGDGTPS